MTRTRSAPLAATLATALLLAAPATAAPPCLPRADAQAIVGWALPALVESAARRCAPSLGADAYLPRSGTALAQRWRATSTADPARARAALGRITGAALPGAIGQALAQQVDESAIADALLDQVVPKECARLDRAIGLVAPLPEPAVAGLVTLIVEIAADSDRAELPFRICAAR